MNFEWRECAYMNIFTQIVNCKLLNRKSPKHGHTKIIKGRFTTSLNQSKP